MCTKGTIDSSSYVRLKVYGQCILEPGYSGTAYTWRCDYDVTYQALPFFSVQHWKTGSGQGTRLSNSFCIHTYWCSVPFLHTALKSWNLACNKNIMTLQASSVYRCYNESLHCLSFNISIISQKSQTALVNGSIRHITVDTKCHIFNSPEMHNNTTILQQTNTLECQT